MRISNWSSDVCSSDLDRNAMARPRPETGFDPVEWPLRAIGRHRFAQDRRARLALLGGKLVEQLDVLIGQVGQDASHDILISIRKSLVKGKGVTGSVELGGRRIIKTTKK